MPGFLRRKSCRRYYKSRQAYRILHKYNKILNKVHLVLMIQMEMDREMLTKKLLKSWCIFGKPPLPRTTKRLLWTRSWRTLKSTKESSTIRILSFCSVCLMHRSRKSSRMTSSHCTCQQIRAPFIQLEMITDRLRRKICMASLDNCHLPVP